MSTPTLPENPEKEFPIVPPVTGTKKKSSRTAWVVGTLVVMVVIAFVFGALIRLLKPGNGEVSGPNNILSATEDLGQIMMNPKQGFPGKNKLVICCMGIDDNWTNGDEEYTVGSRTDTLFLLTLNLVTRKATMMSIPRDTYVPIAGTDYSSKVNSAYASGGPKRTEATIQKWLGVTPDYFIVLNIDATKKMVDALGGVDVNVEHEMNYDDNWGHLHVHLQPGLQHLSGDEAVSFARYRHGNKGVSPEDGDERRMYRQHILMRAMIDKSKSFSNVFQANQLVNVGMSTVHTDLSRTQLFDLAVLFHKLDQDDMTTASLTGDDGRGPNGVYVMLVDKNKATQYVDWLVNGNENAGRSLTPVVVESTAPSAAVTSAVSTLTQNSFARTKAKTVATALAGPTTVIIDGGVADRAAADEVKAALGLPNAMIQHDVPKPNKFGWAPPATLTVVLGSDYKPSVTTQATLAAQ